MVDRPASPARAAQIMRARMFSGRLVEPVCAAGEVSSSSPQGTYHLFTMHASPGYRGALYVVYTLVGEDESSVRQGSYVCRKRGGGLEQAPAPADVLTYAFVEALYFAGRRGRDTAGEPDSDITGSFDGLPQCQHINEDDCLTCDGRGGHTRAVPCFVCKGTGRRLTP